MTKKIQSALISVFYKDGLEPIVRELHSLGTRLLSTGGNVLFVPEADGTFAAYDATNGKKLWTHNNGQGHNGGIITYLAKGKQYVAVETGWGSLVGDGYGDWFGEPWKSMPKDSGVLKVFAVQ